MWFVRKSKYKAERDQVDVLQRATIRKMDTITRLQNKLSLTEDDARRATRRFKKAAQFLTPEQREEVENEEDPVCTLRMVDVSFL